MIFKLLKKIIIIAALSCTCFTMLAACGEEEEEVESFAWPTTGLGALLPDPMNPNCQLITNNEREFYVEIDKVTRDDFDYYADMCRRNGFDIDVESKESSYDAWNMDRYRLKLEYENRTITIDFRAPNEIGAIVWPKSGMGAMLPAPDSNKGYGMEESPADFKVAVAEIKTKQFESYVAQCREKGFNYSYYKDENKYSAKDLDGNTVIVKYSSYFGIMDIAIYSKYETDVPNIAETTIPPTETTKGETQTTTSLADMNKITPGIRDTLQYYERTMNGYCDFMATYTGSPLQQKDYDAWMDKFNDATSKFSSLNVPNFNDNELTYYREVQQRVNDRLDKIKDR